MAHQYTNYDEEEKEAAAVKKDFDCPDCSANNPYEDGIRVGDEVRCFYCGAEFKVELRQDGRWRFREI